MLTVYCNFFVEFFALSKKKSDIDVLDSVSKRLKHVIDTLGVKQSHMASKLGVSPAGLHYILNNDVKFSKNAKKIADYLKISEHWLETGEGEIYEENTSIKTYKIPIFYPDQLKIYYKSQKKQDIKPAMFHITTRAYQNRMIGIFNAELSFNPKFEIGDIIVFEQVANFDDGEVILVYFAQQNLLQLKIAFHLNDNEIALLSNDASSIKVKLNGDSVIVGCYRECLKQYSGSG